MSAVPRGALSGLVVAYEPIWAIGTGEAATPADAQKACSSIRDVVRRADREASEQMRILYGGSVNPDNTEELLAGADVDGVLVGGASLEMAAFVGIARAAGLRSR